MCSLLVSFEIVSFTLPNLSIDPLIGGRSYFKRLWKLSTAQVTMKSMNRL